MRLIHCRTLRLQEFHGSQTPAYAILSHTWQDEEVTFTDFCQGAPSETGAIPERWMKITQACKLALAQGYEYIWVDTCCIDKSSSAELTEAINSMYSWYAKSDKCFAYLCDFDLSPGSSDARQQFLSSRWFSRGWTLQELIAPEELEFYDSSWNFYGSKASLCTDIANKTGIDEGVLRTLGQDLLPSIPVCQKMSWAASRETQRPEDVAYSLLGIFGVHMPLIYGEGTHAFVRLQKKIIKSTNDLTILAWRAPRDGIGEDKNQDYYGVLAPSPKYFAESRDIVLSQDLIYNPDFSITNKGLQTTTALPIIEDHPNESDWNHFDIVLNLHCHHHSRPQEPLGIYLGPIGGSVYGRMFADEMPIEIGRAGLPESLIFLSIKPNPYPTSKKHRAPDPGYNFEFGFTYHPAMGKSIRVLSTYPEDRWDDFAFKAQDTFSFIGINICRTFWQNTTADFVLACGFHPGFEPWVCVDREESDLWYAATDRDHTRVREISQTRKAQKLTLENNIVLSIKLEFFSNRWIAADIYADQCQTPSLV
ncbi:hypothetical protein ANO14919_071750 [Xylariales sp. No.14919]|nr:hypothetical protein ANO14919_071750 [Xylariales sp. No.14919]